MKDRSAESFLGDLLLGLILFFLLWAAVWLMVR
jgi:hypothetical protein